MFFDQIGHVSPGGASLPPLLQSISAVDPITYAVDATRIVLTGAGTFPIAYDIAALLIFAAATGALGLIAFGRLQQAK